MASRAVIIDSIRRQIANGNLPIEQTEAGDVVLMVVTRSNGDGAFRLRLTFEAERVVYEFAREKEFFRNECRLGNRRKQGQWFSVREGDRSGGSHVQNHLAELVARHRCEPPRDEAEQDAAINLEMALHELIANADYPAGRIAEILMDKVMLSEIQEIVEAMEAEPSFRPGR